jgi:hypothetical protein
VEGFCEHGNEHTDSINVRKFILQLGPLYQPLMTDEKIELFLGLELAGEPKYP